MFHHLRCFTIFDVLQSAGPLGHKAFVGRLLFLNPKYGRGLPLPLPHVGSPPLLILFGSRKKCLALFKKGCIYVYIYMYIFLVFCCSFSVHINSHKYFGSLSSKATQKSLLGFDFWGIQGRFCWGWRYLLACWPALGRCKIVLQSILGPTWVVLGPFWVHLWWSWRHLGGSWGSGEPTWNIVEQGRLAACMTSPGWTLYSK